jgi:hypothetical protein
LSDARIHAPELISYRISVDPIEEELCPSLVSWSVEKLDADPSYHPMIVVSNLFRSVMQYMIRFVTVWAFGPLVQRAQNVP